MLELDDNVCMLFVYHHACRIAWMDQMLLSQIRVHA